MGLFGGGNSKSETLNKTENRDMRLVGGEFSTNTSFNVGDGSSANVTLTDHGAVNAGFSLGTTAIDAVVKNGEGLQQTTQSIYSGALDFVGAADTRALSFAKDVNARAIGAVTDAGDQVASAYSKVASDLATAFTDSKAPDKSLLMVGGVIVVGLAAVMVFARKG